MIIKACNRFDVDPEKSVVVGDKKSDLQAGEAAGIRRLILVRSGHQFDEANTQATMIANSIKDITPNTIDAL